MKGCADEAGAGRRHVIPACICETDSYYDMQLAHVAY